MFVVCFSEEKKPCLFGGCMDSFLFIENAMQTRVKTTGQQEKVYDLLASTPKNKFTLLVPPGDPRKMPLDM
jgi:hypothetical protein